MNGLNIRLGFGGQHDNRLLLIAALAVFMSIFVSMKGHAQMNNNHLMLSVGALYERGLDATIA